MVGTVKIASDTEIDLGCSLLNFSTILQWIITRGTFYRESQQLVLKKGQVFLISCSKQEIFTQSVNLSLYLYSYLFKAEKKKKLHKLVLNQQRALI